MIEREISCRHATQSDQIPLVSRLLGACNQERVKRQTRLELQTDIFPSEIDAQSHTKSNSVRITNGQFAVGNGTRCRRERSLRAKISEQVAYRSRL